MTPSSLDIGHISSFNKRIASSGPSSGGPRRPGEKRAVSLEIAGCSRRLRPPFLQSPCPQRPAAHLLREPGLILRKRGQP